MAIFPVSPTVGQEETVLGRTFVYDGYGWVAKDTSGHTFEDSSDNILPTRSVAKAGEGIEFEDDAVNEKTVVKVSESLTDHIDGADEEKHTSNQITHESTPLSTILPQLVNLQDIDVSDINVGEKKVILVEKNAEGDPILSGGVGLLYHVTPEQFGAVGDGTTDDSAAFQSMFDSLNTNRPKKVVLSAKTYLINSTVNLTKVKSGSTTLCIEGYGSLLKTTTAGIRIFNRQPINQSEASVMVSSAIQIKGIKFIGSGLAGQIGLFLGATYGSSIEDCSFGNFETGLRTEFALMTEINNTLFQSCSNRHIDINYGSSWGGSTSNSQSNSTTLRNVRIYSVTGANSCIYIESCSGIHLDNVICEGGNPIDNIYFNGRNSSVVKEFSCRGLHLENTPSNSHITLTSVSDGTYTFKNIFTQYPSKLISNLGSSNIDIIVEDVPWIPSGTKFEGGARWIFKNSNNLKSITKNSSYWVDGIARGTFIGASYQVDPLFSITLHFEDPDYYYIVYTQNYKITNITTQPGVIYRLKIGDSTTDYVLGDVVSAYNKLKLQVESSSVIKLEGELL